ncbi:MAG: tetratricopeptide repeat protein, partial [Proteobacteria bacterium]|nr:tetratricopeptide repeat protein [Pseudomonadota bacterium]
MATEEKLREISWKIDDLFAIGQDEEGRKLLESAIAEAKDNDAYRLFFEGELAHYSGDKETARDKHSQAVALNKDDHFLLKNYGVILSMLDRENEAIALYDQALKIKPDDYHSLRQKGTSLSKLDREEEAIALFDQALKIKPDDYHSLRQKGTSLSK